jgi:hypothetical protein
MIGTMMRTMMRTIGMRTTMRRTMRTMMKTSRAVFSAACQVIEGSEVLELRPRLDGTSRFSLVKGKTLSPVEERRK